MHGRLVSSPPELVRNPADNVQALMTGRPPVIQRDYIDCKFPTPQAPLDEEEGEERDAACEFPPGPRRPPHVPLSLTMLPAAQSRRGASDLR